MKKGLFLFGFLILFVVSTSSFISAATVWYMPEGSTQGSFDLWILVTNPNSETVNIKYTFYTESGAITYTDPDGITENSRETLSVLWLSQQDGYSGLQNQPISTKVECTNGYPIYAERAMYWDAGGISWAGGHTARGIAMNEAPFGDISQPAESSDFPITIDKSGSYKLVSNIDLSSNAWSSAITDTNAINITASNVTLDLNGFTIIGPGYDQESEGKGISVVPNSGRLFNIKIKNGNVYNFRTDGIDCFQVNNLKLHDLNLYSNGDFGINLASLRGYEVINCCFSENGKVESAGNMGGLNGSAGGLIRNNVFYYNYGYGIYLDAEENIVINNTISYTQNNAGIATDSGIYLMSDAKKNRIESNHCTNNSTNDIVDDADGTQNIYIYNSSDSEIVDLNVIEDDFDDQGLNEIL